MKTIKIPNGNHVRIGKYVESMRYCIKNPKTMVPDWQWFPVTGAEVAQDFMRLVQDHCNRGLMIPRDINMKAAYRRYQSGVETTCQGCGGIHIRHNPHNDSDRYCSPSCRV